MHFILFLVLTTHYTTLNGRPIGQTIAMQEFNSKATCEQAATLARTVSSVEKAVCLPK